MARQMGCTVRELGTRLDRAEATEWMAFERIEPGPVAYWHGILEAMATLCTIWGNRRSAADFLPRRYAPKRREQSFQEVVALLTARFPGRVVIEKRESKSKTKTDG
jgi:hypothetical protein